MRKKIKSVKEFWEYKLEWQENKREKGKDKEMHVKKNESKGEW